MNLSAFMDELATRAGAAPSLTGRTHAYPVGAVSPPAAIVPYPDKIDYDETYARGRDVIDGWLVVVIGRPPEPSTRDLAAQYVAGAGGESLKAILEAPGWTTCDSVEVTSADFDAWPIGGVDYLAVVFTLRIIGPGT